jgi:MFS transporter, DHA1 family, tetracycline resistance protein
VYYIQERIGFKDGDVANFFMVLGILGIFMQGVVLKHANTLFGERQLLMICFALGAIHNAMYGLAHTKSSIFLAAAVGTVGAMAFPTISAIKANNVESSEQGRIQGALYSISAVASAIGPVGMRFIYHYTKDGAWFGPGSMFIGVSFVNWLAVYISYLLPVSVVLIWHRSGSIFPYCFKSITQSLFCY